MAVSIEKNLFAIRTILSEMTMSYCDKRARAVSLLPRPTHRDQFYDESIIEDESRPAWEDCKNTMLRNIFSSVCIPANKTQ